MDKFEVISLGLLGLVYLASMGFWFYHYNQLLNKFMSRNYAEFAQSERILKSEPKQRDPEEPDEDLYGLQRAKEVNSLFGIGG